MLLARNCPGDQEKALRLLDEALEMAQAIDMEFTAQSIVTVREQALQSLSVERNAPQTPARLELVKR